MDAQLLHWEENDRDPLDRRVGRWDLMVAGREYPAATVWGNGTWHTWNRDGVGGENSVEDTVARAKIEAAASAIGQGFI